MKRKASVDPRGDATGKLVAPHPLPHISRRAIRRVTNPRPAPSVCRYCFGQVRLADNAEVYGRSYGEWPYLYRCDACDAHVGLHPHTDIPLGLLADKRLREARRRNKKSFHALMHSAGIDRTSAYRWLACKMGIERKQCHWGWFNADQCREAGEICRKELRRMTKEKT